MAQLRKTAEQYESVAAGETAEQLSNLLPPLGATSESEDADGSSTVGAIPLQNDAPIRYDSDDHLGFVEYADALHELIDNPQTQTPLTLAISAPWGAGKSSLGRLLDLRLSGASRRIGRQGAHIVSWFNAWQHQSAEWPAAALAGSVAGDLIERQRWWRRLPLGLFSPLAPSQTRRKYRKWTIAFLTPVAVLGLWLAATTDDVDTGGVVAIASSLTAATTVAAAIAGHAGTLIRFVRAPARTIAHGDVEEARRRIGHLVEGAIRRERKSIRRSRRTRHDVRLVVMIDDLDRIPPDEALAYIEATLLLFDHPGIVVVLLVDGDALERFAASKTGPATDGNGTAPSEFIRKLVQLVFEIPPASGDHAQAVLRGVPREGHDAPTRSPSSVVVDRHGGEQTEATLRELLRWRGRDGDSSLGREVRRTCTAFVLLAPAAALLFVPVIGPYVGGAAMGLLGAAIYYLLFGRVVPALSHNGRLRWRLRKVREMLPAPLDELLDDQSFTQALGAEYLGQLLLETSLLTEEAQLAIRASSDVYLDTSFERLLDEPEAERVRNCVRRATPRDLIRVRNRLRLTHAIAVRRRLIAGTADDPAPLDPARLAKWCVALEFAAPAIRDRMLRGRFDELETAAAPVPRRRLSGGDAAAMLHEPPELWRPELDALVTMRPDSTL